MSADGLSFLAPTSLNEALTELASEESIAVGGGTSVALLLKNQLIEPTKLVWLGKVPELRDLTVGPGGHLSIGAGITLRELERSNLVREHAPTLAEAASYVGNPRVRAVATVGGALAHADPRQDLPPVLLALGAEAHVIGPSGQRAVPLETFFAGWMETTLAEDELVADLSIPVVSGRRACYTRFTPGSEDDYPTVGVAASVDLRGDGVVAHAMLALAAVASRPLLLPETESLLVGTRPGAAEIAAVADAAAAAAQPSSDHRGSADYKKAMAGVWARRALERVLATRPLP